jgi:glycosyltransferase involved in cell wall biosynthesis
MEYRNLLQVAPEKRLIVLVGHLQPYKGVSALLEGAFFLPNNFAIRIAGRADAQYQKELEVTLLELKSQNVDIDIAFGHMTDEEYGAYLKSADFICIPFKEINNSGSINSALCAGVPVIVPNIDSLDWVPRGARLDLPYDSEEHFDFKELFKSLERLSVKEHSSMHKAALNWATTLSWKDVANRHVDVYKELSVDNE